MAAQIGSLYVSMTADVGPFAAGMARAEAATIGATNKIKASAGVAEAAVHSFGRSVNGPGLRPYSLIAVSRAFDNAADRAGLLRGGLLALTGVFGGFAAALSSNLVLRFADTFVRINNQIRVVSDSTADLVGRLKGVQEVADGSRSGLEATALLYSRLQKAAPDRSADQVLNYVETIQKALQLGGATGAEARSAAIQFSQAIASNRLSGDEIRAVLETPLGLELAKGIGVTIGKLREMGSAGKLTADTVLKGLDNIRGEVNTKFEKSVLTVDQALTVLDNHLIEFFGSLNQSTGLTNLFSSAIVGLAHNLDTVASAINVIGLALAANFVSRRVVGNVGGLFTAISTTVTAAKEKAAGLAQELDHVTALRDRALGAGSGALASPQLYVDPSAVKAYERALAEEAAADREHAAIIRDKAKAIEEVGQITRKITPQQIRLSEQQVAAEKQIIAAENEQIRLTQRLGQVQQQARTASLFGAAGSVTGRKSGAEAAAAKELAATQKQIASNEDVLTRAIQKEADTRAKINVSQAASDEKYIDQHIAGVRKLEAIEQEESTNSIRRRTASSTVAITSNVAQRSGQTGAAEEAKRLSGEAAALGRTIATLTPLEKEAARGATLMGLSFSLAGKAWSSVIGLFGGYAGALLTGGLVIFGLLAEKSLQDAQKVARARDILDEALNRAGRGTDKFASEARTQQAERETAALNEEIQTQKDLAKTDIGAVNTRLIQTGVRQIFSARDALTGLFHDLEAGKITTDQFNQSVSELFKDAGNDPRFAKSFEGIKEAIAKARDEVDKLRVSEQQLAYEQHTIGAQSEDRSASLAERRTLPKFIDQRESDTKDAIKTIEDQIAVEKLLTSGHAQEAAALQLVQAAAKNNQILAKSEIQAKLEERDAIQDVTKAYSEYREIQQQSLNALIKYKSLTSAGTEVLKSFIPILSDEAKQFIELNQIQGVYHDELDKLNQTFASTDPIVYASKLQQLQELYGKAQKGILGIDDALKKSIKDFEAEANGLNLSPMQQEIKKVADTARDLVKQLSSKLNAVAFAGLGAEGAALAKQIKDQITEIEAATQNAINRITNSGFNKQNYPLAGGPGVNVYRPPGYVPPSAKGTYKTDTYDIGGGKTASVTHAGTPDIDKEAAATLKDLRGDVHSVDATISSGDKSIVTAITNLGSLIASTLSNAISAAASAASAASAANRGAQLQSEAKDLSFGAGLSAADNGARSGSGEAAGFLGTGSLGGRRSISEDTNSESAGAPSTVSLDAGSITQLTGSFDKGAAATIDVSKSIITLGVGVDAVATDVIDLGVGITSGFANVTGGISTTNATLGTIASEMGSIAAAATAAANAADAAAAAANASAGSAAAAATSAAAAAQSAGGGAGYATGGSFMVGGSGGTDSQLVQFYASPDEKITIETPAQQRQKKKSNLPHFAFGGVYGSSTGLGFGEDLLASKFGAGGSTGSSWTTQIGGFGGFISDILYELNHAKDPQALVRKFKREFPELFPGGNASSSSNAASSSIMPFGGGGLSIAGVNLVKSGTGYGFAKGGSFKPGGVGGADSQLVQFYASPDETVTIETPEQRRRRRHFANGGSINGSSEISRVGAGSGDRDVTNVTNFGGFNFNAPGGLNQQTLHEMVRQFASAVDRASLRRSS